MVFVPNIATNHAITYTNNVNSTGYRRQNGRQPRSTGDEVAFVSVEQEKWRNILHVLQSRYCQTFALKTWQEQQKYC